jgi:hypothetical protein
MIDQQAVFEEIWPAVHQLIQATSEEDLEAIPPVLVPNRPAALLFELFGVQVMHILLKTILGRDQVSLIGAVETENGKFVHLEFAWLEPEASEVTAVDIVTVTLRRYRRQWRVTDVHPSMLNAPLTEPRAQLALATLKAATEDGQVPGEPWVLPYMLFGGALQLPLQEERLRDAVEKILLPGLQARTHGVASLMIGARLWRDFRKKDKSPIKEPELFAAAAEYILSEQSGRKLTPAAVGGYYGLGLVKVLGPIRRIKGVLEIKEEDARYSPNSGTRIIME